MAIYARDDGKGLSQEELVSQIADSKAKGIMAYKDEKYEEALFFFEKSYRLAGQAFPMDEKEMVLLCMHIAETHKALSNYEQAIFYFEKALAGALPYRAKDPWLVIRVHNKFADVLFMASRFELGIEHYNKALNILQTDSLEPTEEVAKIYENAGNLTLSLRNYEHAVTFYQKALDVLTQLGGSSQDGKGAVYQGLGLVYLYTEEYEKSLTYFDKARVVYAGGAKQDMLVNIHLYIAGVHFKKEDYDQALKVLEDTLRLTEQGENMKRGEADVYGLMGACYLGLDDVHKALFYYRTKEEPLRRSLSFDDAGKVTLANLYKKISNIYSRQYDYSKAILYSRKAINMVLPLPEKEEILFDLYIGMGNYYIMIRKPKAAIVWLGKANGLLKEKTTTSNTLVGRIGIYNLTGHALYLLDHGDLAVQYFSKAHTLALDVLGENDPSTQNIAANLAAALERKKG